jgi:hypothetical protein
MKKASDMPSNYKRLWKMQNGILFPPSTTSTIRRAEFGLLTGNAQKVPAEASDLLRALRATGIEVRAETTGRAADDGSTVLLVGYQ